MMNNCLTVIVISAVFSQYTLAFPHKNIYRRSKLCKNPKICKKPPSYQNLADPLILTPYIDASKISKAQKLSRVTNLTDVISYSGYFTVNRQYNSSMYFWFFPAAFHPEKAPVLLWLQGGPGSSSLYGLFVENGPFIVDSSNTLQFRTTSWAMTHSVIYIDNPVGSGFSYTQDDRGYARTEEDVAKDLYSALTQFFTLFPEYRARDFFVAGESYAGKYVPAISYKIHRENNLSPKVKIHLKGMVIGDGFSDPENMLNYGEYLYNIGLLDYKQKLHFQKEEEKARRLIRRKQWISAFNTIDELIEGDLIHYPSYFKNSTGFDFYYNFLMAKKPKDQDYFYDFLDLPYVHQALHVGSKKFLDGNDLVEKYMRTDFYQSVVNWIVKLLDAEENYQVLIYSGQLDIIVANTLIENSLRKMKWHGSQDFTTADRKQWRVGKDLAGYVKVIDNLTYLLVRNAGHFVPYDQPKWAFDMINRFTSGKPFASYI